MTKISPLSLVAVVVMATRTRVIACVGYKGAPGSTVGVVIGIREVVTTAAVAVMNAKTGSGGGMGRSNRNGFNTFGGTPDQITIANRIIQTTTPSLCKVWVRC